MQGALALNDLDIRIHLASVERQLRIPSVTVMKTINNRDFLSSLAGSATSCQP